MPQTLLNSRVVKISYLSVSYVSQELTERQILVAGSGIEPPTSGLWVPRCNLSTTNTSWFYYPCISTKVMNMPFILRHLQISRTTQRTIHSLELYHVKRRQKINFCYLRMVNDHRRWPTKWLHCFQQPIFYLKFYSSSFQEGSFFVQRPSSFCREI